MLCSLIAYDANGDVVETLHHMVALDDEGKVTGLIDFAAHENAGGRLRDIWTNPKFAGSGTWPEWLGSSAHDFTVELDPNPSPARARIKALVHKASGYRRERADIEARIAERINEKKLDAAKRGEAQRALLKKRGVPDEVVVQFSDPPPEPADIRDIVGGPDRPLLLDDNGKTMAKPKVERPKLPIVGR